MIQTKQLTGFTSMHRHILHRYLQYELLNTKMSLYLCAFGRRIKSKDKSFE
jgi:hypothetical protein